ncbi:MAG: hypothetical protein JO223_07840 [Hyphomicrobiales bacterium]|nr:hypothetical protein [Hyphomicrobiales bacterium]
MALFSGKWNLTMSVTLSGCQKPNRKFRLHSQRIYVGQAAAIDFKRIKIRFGEASVRLGFLCAAGALLMLPAFVWAHSLSSNLAELCLQALSYSLGDQAQTLDAEPEFGAIDPTELLATNA